MESDSRWDVRRGLNRTFVVFSFCWYFFAGLVLFPQWRAALEREHSAAAEITARHNGTSPRQPNAPPPGAGQGKSQADSKTPTFLTDEQWEARYGSSAPLPQAAEAAQSGRPIKTTIIFSLVPPALYGFAAATFWVVRGFRVDSPGGSA